jgi:hypothetical protein
VLCEVSKCIDGVSISACKKMIRVIRFMLDTTDTCLKVDTNLDNKNWDLVVYSDNYWAGDVETRISVTDSSSTRWEFQFIGGQKVISTW